MKILYHHRIRSKDGQAVHIKELIGALRALGHEVIIVGPGTFNRTSFGHDPKVLGRMKQMLPKALYAILELGYNIPAYLRLHRAWRRHRPDVLYERYSLNLVAGTWLRKLDGPRLLLEVNSPLVRERTADGRLGLRRLAHRLEQWVWRNADFVLPVTAVLAEELRMAGVAAERIVVIPNAIDPERFAHPVDATTLKAGLGLAGKVVLGFTGFVRRWHGLDVIVDWLGSDHAPRELHLLLVGEGPALRELKEQATRLGIRDRITFTGLVDHDAVARMVSAFDIALQPKCVEYASPLKLFEYMALGKAIVAPDQPNMREVLVPDVNGLLYEPSEMSSLTTAIIRLAGDAALRRRLGAEAQNAIAAKGFTWTENAKRVVALAEAAKTRNGTC